MEVRDSETSKKEKREQTKPLPSRCSFGEDPPKKEIERRGFLSSGLREKHH
jgi:hypothetical protein